MTYGLDRVTVRFGDQVAIRDVSLDVEPGSIAVVVGGDGAGKTTLCRTLVGLESVDEGRVRRPHRTGFQPASSGVWDDLTVSENLGFVARAYRLDPDHARERIAELLDATDLESARDRLGRHLSGGMRQKLGVAMAVLSEPELLVLDEPTTGLDPLSRLELWSFISRTARAGRAVLMTTTYVEEASRADTVLALDQGAVLAAGSIGEIISAMPGRVFEAGEPRGEHSWRRGRRWRVWSADGVDSAGLAEATVDLGDVITLAALRGEGS